MKQRTTERKLFRSIAEFQKEYLPEKYKTRKENRHLDAHSIGIQMARDIIESVRLSSSMDTRGKSRVSKEHN